MRDRGVAEWLERRVGLTPSGAGALGMAAVGWVVARLAGARVLFFVVYALVALVAAAWVAGRRRPGAEVRRSELPVRVREGQIVAVELAMTARRRLSTLVLAEELPSRLGTPVRLPVPTLPAGREVRYAYTFTPRLRGVYDIGPLVAIRRDPFGLTSRRIPLLTSERIIVHPRTEAAQDRILSREWEDPPIRPPTSKPWPTGFEFYGMREYVPGDDPRRIVWRAVARTGRYLVREAEQGITDRVTIVVDDDRRKHTPGEVSSTFETAVRAAASVGVKHLEDGYAVTLDASSGRVAEALRGQRMRIRFLDAIAGLELGGEPLAAAMRRVATNPRRDTHYVVVATELAPETAATIRLVVDRGGSVLFVHVQSEDAEPEAATGAAALGCEVVELRAGEGLEGAFRRGVGAGLRR